MQEAGYEVVWPLGRQAGEIIRPAPRPETLAGKTVGEIWNMIFRGDTIYAKLEELLSKRYPGIKFVHHSEFGYAHGGWEDATMAALPQKLKEKGVDVLLSSVAG